MTLISKYFNNLNSSILFKIAVILSVILLSSCKRSSIPVHLRSNKQELSIETFPAGATVVSSSGQECLSPCSLNVRLGRDIELDISKSGFKPLKVKIGSVITTRDGIEASLIPLLSFITIKTGQIYTLEKDKISVTLEKSPSPDLKKHSDTQ